MKNTLGLRIFVVVLSLNFYSSVGLTLADADSEVKKSSSEAKTDIKIRAHKSKVEVSQCLNCHLKKSNQFINPKMKPQRNHEEKTLRHGKGEVACGACHDRNASNQLRTSPENPASFAFSSPVCMQCHVDIFRDWRDGIHGKRIGGWNLPKEQYQCIDCHDPHAVSFKKMQADPPPYKAKFHIEKLETTQVADSEILKSNIKSTMLEADSKTVDSGLPESKSNTGKSGLPEVSDKIVKVGLSGVKIENRIASISSYPCSRCHNDFSEKKVIEIKLPMLREHKDLVYKHLKDKKSCLLCHSQKNTDQLVMLDGRQISMGNPSELCGQCHGPIYSEWQQGIHGKLFAKNLKSSDGGLKVNCTTCHNAHDPKFKKYIADPAPKKAKFNIEKIEEPDYSEMGTKTDQQGDSHGE
jgi:hypothetical protein